MDFQNNGHVSDAIKLDLFLDFEEINFQKVHVSDKENDLPSKRVLEKRYFTYEGTLQDFFVWIKFMGFVCIALSRKMSGKIKRKEH